MIDTVQQWGPALKKYCFNNQSFESVKRIWRRMGARKTSTWSTWETTTYYKNSTRWRRPDMRHVATMDLETKKSQPFSSVAVNRTGYLCFVFFVRQCGRSAAVSSPLPRKTPQLYTPWARAVTRGTLRFTLVRQMRFLRYTLNKEIFTLNTVDWWRRKYHTTFLEGHTIIVESPIAWLRPWTPDCDVSWTSPHLSRKYSLLRVCSHIHKHIGYATVVVMIALMLRIFKPCGI